MPNNGSNFLCGGLREYFHSESTYPVELFGESSCQGNDFCPQAGEAVMYRTNPAMNKGTAVFSSGYWRKGVVVQIDKCEKRGTLYTVKDDITDYIFQINRHQIRPSTT